MRVESRGRWSGVAAIAAAALAMPVLSGSGKAAVTQQFSTGTTGVVVDVVVRDKRGQPVLDLAPGDFELREDGVPQAISSVELRGASTVPDGAASGAASAVTATPATEAPLSPEPPRFTALVFDRLEGESMRIARDGAGAAISTAGRSDVLAVFVIDGGLRMLQGFTTDKPRLTAAVDRAVQRAAMLTTRDRSGKRHDGGSTPAAVPGAEYAGGDDGSDATRTDRGPAGKIADMSAVITRSTEMLERQFQGHWSTDALITAGAALTALPGRKTLIYFSDALAVPDIIAPRLDDVVATANRGQVTIYAVDTAGLRVGSQEMATAREVNAVGNASLAVNPDGSSGSSLATMERNEDALRRSPRVGMTLLSKPTGGFLIENTNDLAAGVRRIDADRRIHYLLNYTPRRIDLDGTWRAIDVKVKRRDVTVQARQGYVAVRSPGGLPVLVYEGPALAAVDRTPVPRDIRTATAVFAFPRTSLPHAGDTVTDDLGIVVAAPADALTFETNGGKYRTDFTMLALVRDPDGRTVHKTSQPYRLSGPAAARATALRGEARLARTLPIAPGSYHVAVAVYDTASGRAGVVADHRIEVPGRGETGLGMSSLVILKKLERASEATRQRSDLLIVGDLAITPFVNFDTEGLFRTTNAKLAFLFTMAGAHPGERLAARVQVVPSGVPDPAVLFDAPITLDPADAQGRVISVGQLPLKDLPYGGLELRVTVQRFGSKSESRRTIFQLHPPEAEGKLAPPAPERR